MTALRLGPTSDQASSTRGTLFVVATPIGNLEDITLRALRILGEVALIAAEDTRRTSKLLRHYQISTPMLSVHEHNEQSRIPRVLERLGAGASVALVSDAGTPGISDPGAGLVRAARAAGFSVVPVPGASALAASVSVSGVSDAAIVFAGFPPNRAKARKQWVATLTSEANRAVVFFEAPHRLRQTLSDLEPVLVDRPILVGREVSKLHEEWYEGTARDLLEHFRRPQGEFVLTILPASAHGAPPQAPDDQRIAAMFYHLTENVRLERRAALRETAERLQVSVKAAYAAVERSKKIW